MDGWPSASRSWLATRWFSSGSHYTYAIPRHSCRFEYVPRTAGLSRYQFEIAGLLQARCKAPFTASDHIVLHNRYGLAIWWWDREACLSNTALPATHSHQVLPESICQALPDGWHHLRLTEGFELRHIERGMVIGSAWRRQPFGLADWQAFLNDEGGDLIAPDMPPPVVDARNFPRLHGATGGRRLIRATSMKEHLISMSLVSAFVLGGALLGLASAHATAAEIATSEATRLESFLQSYHLFARIRKEQARIRAAHSVAGNGTGAIRFALVLQMTAKHKLQVSALQLDTNSLLLTVVTTGSARNLRALAAELEALPFLSEVAATQGEQTGEMQLTAKVAS